MMALSADTKVKFIPIIDSILAASDLNTISEKRVRKGLQAAVDYDITPYKDAIKELIMARFDKFMAEQNEPQANGHEHKEKAESPNGHGSPIPKARLTSEEDESEMGGSPMPTKKRKTEEESDAAFAARLQALENSQRRATRGGGPKPSKVVKKKAKKKTSARVRSEDDSDLDGSEMEVKKRKVNRETGFHKELMLSPPLSALLNNEIKLSRPQTVKRIWEYVRARDLQDPNDKRMIRCDDPMKAVFKQDKVHMFTMNKILNQNLYAQDE